MNNQLVAFVSHVQDFVLSHPEQVVVFTIAFSLVAFVGTLLWLRKRILSQIRIYKIESWSNEPQSHLSLTKTTMDNMGLKTSWTGLSPHFTQNGKDQFQPYEMHRGQFPEWPKPTTQWKNENDEKFVLGRKKAPLLPRKLFITFGIFALLALITLFVWRVGIPAIAKWHESRQQMAETIEAPVTPTHPEPLAAEEDILPAPSTPEPAPESIEEVEFKDTTLVIDLDDPYERTPSAIEQRLNEWISKLPTGPGPNIHLQQGLADLFAGGDHTIISLGDDGFVIVSSWTHGLEYRRTDESLNQIGDKISLYGNCGTIIAGEHDGQLRWGICFKGDNWKVSKYAKGGYDVVVYGGGLVVDTKGFYPRWTPLWLLALIPLAAVGYLIWHRR